MDKNKIKLVPCGNCDKVITILCSRNSKIIGAKCPKCQIFDMFKKQTKSKPSDNSSSKKDCLREEIANIVFDVHIPDKEAISRIRSLCSPS